MSSFSFLWYFAILRILTITVCLRWLPATSCCYYIRIDHRQLLMNLTIILTGYRQASCQAIWWHCCGAFSADVWSSFGGFWCLAVHEVLSYEVWWEMNESSVTVLRHLNRFSINSKQLRINSDMFVNKHFLKKIRAVID